jgi:hypothetical protein
MNENDILKDAYAAPQKITLEQHRDTVRVLREKGYTWREIASFLTARGIPATHTTVLRLTTTSVKKNKPKMTTSSLPTASDYQNALERVEVTFAQRAMLKAHYDAPNRSITYTQLAKAAGFDTYDGANAQYGKLGRKLGEAIGFEFVDSDTRLGEKFYSSALGIPNPYPEGHFQLVMHHELAKAIASLGPTFFARIEIYRLGQDFAAKNIENECVQAVSSWISDMTWDDTVVLDCDFIQRLASILGREVMEFPAFAENSDVINFIGGIADNLSIR